MEWMPQRGESCQSNAGRFGGAPEGAGGSWSEAWEGWWRGLGLQEAAGKLPEDCLEGLDRRECCPEGLDLPAWPRSADSAEHGSHICIHRDHS